MIGGGNHHRHVFQKEVAPACRLSKVSGVCVVRGINKLSFNRRIRSYNHLHAISLRIVLNFVHDVVDEEHPSARRSK